jgi:hypothetical protein
MLSPTQQKTAIRFARSSLRNGAQSQRRNPNAVQTAISVSSKCVRRVEADNPTKKQRLKSFMRHRQKATRGKTSIVAFVD